MKKILLWVVMLIWIWTWLVSACECFWDPIYEVNIPAKAKQWVNIRNLPCMHASKVVMVAKAWQKMRIVTKDDWRWYKVALYNSNWNVVEWRVAQSFVSKISSWSWIPAKAWNHVPKSYCDTTDINRCPTWPACSKDVIPTFTYKDNSWKVDSSTSNWDESSDNSSSNSSSTVSNEKMDKIIDNFLTKLEKKYTTVDFQIKKVESIILALNMLKEKNSKFTSVIDYLVWKLEEYVSMKKIWWLLDL